MNLHSTKHKPWEVWKTSLQHKSPDKLIAWRLIVATYFPPILWNLLRILLQRCLYMLLHRPMMCKIQDSPIVMSCFLFCKNYQLWMGLGNPLSLYSQCKALQDSKSGIAKQSISVILWHTSYKDSTLASKRKWVRRPQ